MSATRPLLAALVCAAGCHGGAATPAREAGPSAPVFPEPLWMADGVSHGLAEREGALVAGSKRLPFEPPLPGLVEAAYHASEGLATAVSRDGTAVLYRERDGQLVEEKRSTAPFAARLGAARLTRVPGLLYVLRIDLAAEEALRRAPDVQAYPDRYERLALSASAEPWDAIPVDGVGRCSLKAYTALLRRC